MARPITRPTTDAAGGEIDITAGFGGGTGDGGAVDINAGGSGLDGSANGGAVLPEVFKVQRLPYTGHDASTYGTWACVPDRRG